MKLFHRMILRALPGPFFGWLGTLMFLLLMQFLIRYLPDITGRGLPLGLIVELVAYNLAYMVVLAVPMSALLAVLMAFGHLAESRAYLVIKNSGVSLMQLLWPVFIAGLMLTTAMTYFNNVILPESNFRARNLWQDIRSKRPDFELQPGIFYDGLTDYSILVKDRLPDSDELSDVLIYDYTEGSRRSAVIKARRGWLKPAGSYVDLILENGEMHRLIQVISGGNQERYERLAFYRLRLRLDLSEFTFERSDPRQGYRSDRTTPTADMIRFVDSLERSIVQEKDKLRRISLALGVDSIGAPSLTDQAPGLPTLAELDTMPPPIHRVALGGLNRHQGRTLYDYALEGARKSRSRVENFNLTIGRQTVRANRYRVEIHKKYSIAVACLIFMLIGAPLGLSIRRGGLGTIGGLAITIFLFYWVTLVQGEKLADRSMLDPWIGMWIANILMAMTGLWLVFYVALDLRATPPLRQRFLEVLRRRR